MIINKSPEPIIKIEITKNLEALNESLNQELAVGIDDIKKSFQNNLAKQKELNARLVDLKFKEQKDTFLSPKMKLLKAHNKLLLTVKKEYENLQMNWEQAKENFIFRK
jgi:L-cysteine desulfidase